MPKTRQRRVFGMLGENLLRSDSGIFDSDADPCKPRVSLFFGADIYRVRRNYVPEILLSYLTLSIIGYGKGVSLTY